MGEYKKPLYQRREEVGIGIVIMAIIEAALAGVTQRDRTAINQKGAAIWTVVVVCHIPLSAAAIVR
jgi:hypothetical protein